MAEEPTDEAAAKAIEDVEHAAKSLKEAAETADASAQSLSTASHQANSLIDQIHQVAASVGGGPADFVYLLAIFILAIFVGYYVVWSVTPALHTPLMSVTNAISSVVIVGALIAVGADLAGNAVGGWSKLFGFGAVTGTATATSRRLGVATCVPVIPITRR